MWCHRIFQDNGNEEMVCGNQQQPAVVELLITVCQHTDFAPADQFADSFPGSQLQEAMESGVPIDLQEQGRREVGADHKTLSWKQWKQASGENQRAPTSWKSAQWNR